MGVIRSRGFVPSFSPFVSDPKSEPSVIRPVYRCSYQPHIRSPLVGGRTNIPLTGVQGLKRTRPIFRSALQGQRGGAVVHLDLLGLTERLEKALEKQGSGPFYPSTSNAGTAAQ